MTRLRTIDIVPHHVPVGDGVVHEEFKVICECGFYDKAESYPTHAGSKRAAIILAMNHNTRAHGYKYKIKGVHP